MSCLRPRLTTELKTLIGYKLRWRARPYGTVRTLRWQGARSMKRFEVGARVVEPTYGLGSVIAVEDAYTRVQFDEHGVKKFMTSMSKLEPSNEPVPAGLRAGKPRKKRDRQGESRRRAPSPSTPTGLRLYLLYDSEIPSPDGDTMVVQSDGIALDRVEKIPHLAALVHHVVRGEQAALVQPRIAPGRETSCSRASTRRGRRSRRCPAALESARRRRRPRPGRCR